MTPPPFLGSSALLVGQPAGEGGAAARLPRAPERAYGVELLGEVAGSGYRRAPGLVRRGDGQTVQLTPLLYALLDELDGVRQPADIAVELGGRVERSVTADDVEQLLAKLRPLGLLRTGDGSVQTVGKANPLLALTCKVVVTDPELTRRITAPFARLFSPLVVVPALVAFLVTCWWVLVDQGLSAATSQAFYSPGLLLTVVGLTVLSAGFHEFGHAAACRYGGATPGAMGAGLYLLWPAFYTDVDDSYRLDRWGRLRVDLGGLYFNALVSVAFAGLALATGVEALLLVVATQLMQMVRQLAPFIRADGYHILADLTGVPDLFAHIGPTLRGLLPPRWGRPATTPLKPWARVVVTAWVLVMVPLLIGLLVFLIHLLPRLAATAWDSLGVQGRQLADHVAAGDPVMIAVRLLALVSVLLPVAAISYLLVRIVRRAAAKVLRATDDRPQARLVAGLAAAFLAAVVAGAWWPSGQYEPVAAPGAGPPPVAAAPVTAAAPAAAAPVVAEPEDDAAAARVDAAPGSSTRPATGVTRSGATVTSTARVLPAPAQAAAPSSRGQDSGWPFPFAPPLAPRAHDAQALAVGLVDGAVVHDVVTSWQWVTDGSRVDHRNEAYALASCEGCTTVAVAFSVVLVVGQADVYTPLNSAVGVNYGCTQCTTRAVAVQLVATLTEMPTAEVQARLQAAWAQVQGLQGRVRGMTVEETYALLRGVESTMLGELAKAGVLAAAQSDAADQTVSAGVDGVPVDGVPVDGVPVDGVPVDGVPVDQVPAAELTEPTGGVAGPIDVGSDGLVDAVEAPSEAVASAPVDTAADLPADLPADAPAEADPALEPAVIREDPTSVESPTPEPAPPVS